MVQEILQEIIRIALSFWWIIIPLVLFFVLLDLREIHKAVSARSKISWVMLDLRIPKDNLKTPRAMELFFASLHSIKGWLSFEIFGSSDGPRFFMRVPTTVRTLVEAALLSQYPDAEVNETRDYMQLLPKELPNKEYDLWGADIVLVNPDPYPIKTYPSFEEAGDDETSRIDPLATVAEVVSNLKEGEKILIQILIRPASKTEKKRWKEKGKEIVNKLAGRKAPAKAPGFLDNTKAFGRNLLLAPFKPPEWPSAPEAKDKAPSVVTAGEREVMKNVEAKLSKSPFETAIRFVYIDNKGSFTPSNVTALLGAWGQFNTQHMNAFGPLKSTVTEKSAIKSRFKKAEKLADRKKSLYEIYRERFYPEQGVLSPNPGKSFILNPEELATIYHLPAISVAAPQLRRVESKRGGPPSNLPLTS